MKIIVQHHKATGSSSLRTHLVAKVNGFNYQAFYMSENDVVEFRRDGCRSWPVGYSWLAEREEWESLSDCPKHNHFSTYQEWVSALALYARNHYFDSTDLPRDETVAVVGRRLIEILKLLPEYPSTMRRDVEIDL